VVHKLAGTLQLLLLLLGCRGPWRHHLLLLLLHLCCVHESLLVLAGSKLTHWQEGDTHLTRTQCERVM
jgi:hypothetical protein